MRTTFLALFGLFSFTVLCPISMGAMPMDTENMQMGHMTQDENGEKGAMPCEDCQGENEEVIAPFNSQTEFAFSISIFTNFLAYWNPVQSVDTHKQRPFFANGPPIPTEALVGIVVLHI